MIALVPGRKRRGLGRLLLLLTKGGGCSGDTTRLEGGRLFLVTRRLREPPTEAGVREDRTALEVRGVRGVRGGILTTACTEVLGRVVIMGQGFA